MTRCSSIVYDFAKDFEFRFCKISGTYNVQGAFSDIRLPFTHFTDESGSYTPMLTLDDLLDFDVKLLNDPQIRPEELKEPFEYLLNVTKTCRCEEWTVSEKASEKKVLLYIAEKIIVPLFGHIIFEKNTYSGVEKTVRGATSRHMGIGNRAVWYGSADFRVDTCNFVPTCLKLTEEGHEDYSDDEEVEKSQSTTAALAGEFSCRKEGNESSMNENSSDEELLSSASTLFEGKPKINFREHIGQLVATAVVSSFTEHNLNPSMNPVVPTIWINRNAFRICLYDCVNDVLLLSQPKSLTTKGTISRTAMLIMWLIVHHR